MPEIENSPQSIWFKKITNRPIEGDDWLTKKLLTYNTWWHNPTNPNSLRLSRLAWNILKSAPADQFNFVKFELPDPIFPKTLLQLERHFTAPYFIQNHTVIHCLGETEIMMLSLHGNNLQQYLDNYSR